MSYKKFTKDIILLGLTQLVIALGGIAILPVITKLLGAENYGIWTQLMVTISLLGPIAFLGLPYTLVRFLAGEKDKKEIRDGIWSVLTLIASTTIALSSLLIIFAQPISHFFGCSKILVQILAVVIIFDFSNGTFLNIFRAFQQTKEYCFFVIFQELAETGSIIVTISLGYGLLGALLSLLIIRATLFLIMGSLVIKRVGIKIPQFLRIKEYLKFGLPNLFGDTVQWIAQSSDRYLIGFFLGTLFVGYYSPAYTLGSSMVFFTAPLLFILPAVLSEHYDGERISEVKKYLKYSLKYFLALSIPAVFGLSILSEKLLVIFSTRQIADHSYYIVPLVALSILFFGAYVIVAQILALKKKTHIGGITWLVAALLNFGLNLILIPHFGIMGAAITTLLAYFFVFTTTWYYAFKELHFEIDWRFIIKSILASVIMTIMVVEFNPMGLWKTLVAIGLGAVCYFFFLFLFQGFGKNEITFFTNFIKAHGS